MVYILDGALTEWTGADRLDRPGVSPLGYQVFGRVEGNSYVFALQAPVAIGATTTFWLNTDQNSATGYQIFGFAGGAEYNVNFFTDNTPYLYSGADGQNLVSGPLQYAYSADRHTVEFVVPFDQIGEADGNANILIDVNNQTFLPGDYSAAPLTVTNPATLPQPTDTGLKVGIVYSATSAAKFFDSTAYSDLFMSAQNQAAMAGVPYDLLTEADLKDINKLINYDALIFPSFQNVNKADVAAIQTALDTAVYEYGIGLITAGNFMTNDETGAALAGDSYVRMKSLFGIGLQGSANGQVVVRADDVTHPVMTGYSAGEQIRDYASIGTQYFGDLTGSAKVLATQSINGGPAQSAILATTTGGKNVHFATEGMLADNNMLEDAIKWTTHDASEPVLSLQMSRQSAIFAARNDLDEAMQLDEVNPSDNSPGIYDKLLPILQQWKTAYNFVGTYYIDVGDGTNDTGTNWPVSAPYYKSLISMGNEIGSHSITHPEDTNLLTDAQLQTEFQQSKLIIEQNFAAQGITDPKDPTKPYLLAGAAIPGASEKLAVSEKVIDYYDYLSGRTVTIGAGYPGAFGYMLPDENKVYLAPNISSDFTLIGFQQMTPDQATAAWQREWQNATSHASLPVVVFPWHDYGITGFVPGYNTQMFESLIQTAFNAGSEFVTLMDLAKRVSAFSSANLKYDMVDADTISVNVGSSGSLGTFALDLSGQTIKSVAGSYAYDADSVFLPKSGGILTIDLGSTQDDVTHISTLPSRAELLAATSPGGGGLDFSVVGEGTLLVDLEALNGRGVSVTGAQIASLAGDKLALSLTGLGQHDVSIRLQTQPVVAIAAPTVITLAEGPGAAAFSYAVARSGATTASSTVNWAVAGSGTSPTTAGDFAAGTALSGVLTFAAGETSKTILLPVLNDAVVEANESFTLTLSNPTGATLGTAMATGTITNDDQAQPVVAIAAPTAITLAEGPTAATFSYAVARSGATTASSTVNWAVAGSGTSPTTAGDFAAGTALSGVLTFAAGETSKTILLPVLNDAVVEANESFTLTLSNPTGATLGTAVATGTITNDDQAQPVVLALQSLVSNATRTTIGGTATPGSTVTVLDGAAGLGSSVVANSTTGTWSVQAGALSDTVHTITATANAAGISGTSSNIGLVGSSNRDTLTGGAGGDILLGKGGADALNGGAGNDSLDGGAGADSLAGGSGNDGLTGGAGADWFRYSAPGEGIDTITDFARVDDSISISAAGFGGGLTAGMNLAATGRFIANTTGTASSATGVGQFVYETDVGKLWWDVDGGGAAAKVAIADFTGHPSVTVSDIIIIA